MRYFLSIRNWNKWIPLVIISLVCGVKSEAEDPVLESFDTLSGRWIQRKRIEKTGIHPFARFTTEFWGDVDGGVKTGYRWNQLLDFGADIDLEKLGGWKGARIMAQGHWVQNSRRTGSFSDYTGASIPISGIAAHDHLRVYNLYYRQAWMEDAFVFKIGQIAADEDFMLSEYASLFANSSFGAMPSQVDRPVFPIWPVAAPGLYLKVQPSKPFFFQAGIYHGDAGQDTDTNHGFDWTEETPVSAAVFCESGLHYSLRGHAATTRLGGTYHSGDHTDYALVNAGYPNAVDQGFYSVYAIQDLALILKANGSTALGMFWRGGIKPEPNRNLVAGYTDAGLNWFGPLPGRAEDIAGIGVGITRFGREYCKTTGPAGVATGENTVELAYKAQITRWLSLQADVQWLFNPALSPLSGSRETATVIGMRAQLSF